MEKKSFIIKPWLIILFGIIVAILPIMLTLGASRFADSHGCRLDEAGPHACIVNGVDYGDKLYGLGLMFFLAIFSTPIGGIIIVIGLVKAILNLRKRQTEKFEVDKKIDSDKKIIKKWKFWTIILILILLILFICRYFGLI